MRPGVGTTRHDSESGIIQASGFAIGVCICVVLGLAFSLKTPRAVSHASLFQIEEKINPNIASPASLARLPRIGLTRARMIVAYRRKLVEQGCEGGAFRRPEDLCAINGIGPATVADIRPWLQLGPSPDQGTPIAGNAP